MLDDGDFEDLNSSVNKQGVKRKKPSWNLGYREEKVRSLIYDVCFFAANETDTLQQKP